MTHIEGQVDIAPYLNPNHWDGHTLGIGDLNDSASADYNFGESNYARKVINARVRSNAVVPLHTFQQGQIFNTAGYEPGTVVLFHEEILYGSSVEDDYNVDELMEQELPPRSTVTSPSFGDNAPFTFAKDGKRQYASSARWGVVPRINQADHLLSTPATFVIERGIGARACSPFLSTHAPILVGESLHTPPRQGVSERLLR